MVHGAPAGDPAGASHYIQFDRPDVVIAAVADVVAAVRQR